MKKTKRKIILIGTLILILIIFLFQINKAQKNTFQEELIFFKLFSSKKEEDRNTLISQNLANNNYEFHLSYKNIDFKNIYLTDTINSKTLICGKVAPRNRRKI